MFHVVLVKSYLDAELNSDFFLSHIGRVARRLLRDSDEVLIMFLERCWDKTASDNLRRLKGAILGFGNEGSKKGETAQGIQGQILKRFPEADEEKAEKRALEDFEAIKCAFKSIDLPNEIRPLRNGLIAHVDLGKIIDNENNGLSLETVIDAVQETIKVIVTLEIAWGRAEKSGRTKLHKLDCDAFWQVMKENQKAKR